MILILGYSIGMWIRAPFDLIPFQNTQVIQCLIENAKWLFAEDQTIPDGTKSKIISTYLYFTQIIQAGYYLGLFLGFAKKISISAGQPAAPPKFLEKVRYIQPIQKQIPLSKR